MDSTKQLDLVSLLLKSADEKKYSRASMPKDVRNHWARQAVREENGAYSPRTQRRLLESFMSSPYSEEKEDVHPHSEDLRAELSSRPESYYHKDSLKGARKLLASAKETLKAGRNHIAENKFLYRTAAQMVGMAGLAGAARYGSGVAAKAVHNKIKSHIEARNAPKELGLGGKVKKGLSELEKVVKHNPKLAAGLGAGALVAGGAGVAMHEHHKKAGVNMGAYGIDKYVKSHGSEEHSKQASLKQLLSRALHADEFEKTAEATRFLMPVEKRAELFTDFVNQGFSVKEAADKVDSIELAFNKMGSAYGDALGDVVDKGYGKVQELDNVVRKKLVGSVKAHPLAWTAGAVGSAGAVGGYALHSSNKGTANQ